MPGVGVFIDFENIYYTLIGPSYRHAPDGDRLARIFRDVALRHGDMDIARAYADWSRLASMMPAIDRYGIEPIFVASKIRGTTEQTRKNSSDIEMTLDVAEALFTRNNVGLYILFSGDGDFISVVERLKRNGKRIIVGALQASASSELLDKANEVVRLDDVLGIAPSTPPPAARAVWTGPDNWTPLIEKLYKLQAKLPYVTFGLILKKMEWDRFSPPLDTEEQQKQYLNRARDLGIFRVEHVPNTKGPKPVVSTCLLNRNHPLVQPVVEAIERRRR